MHIQIKSGSDSLHRRIQIQFWWSLWRTRNKLISILALTQIYLTAIRPLVDCAFDGARVSCFAYGQTGSGKTHTMLGDGNTVRGLYLLAAYDIFRQVQNQPNMSVWISFYEIYCGKLYDLLNDRNVLFAR